MPNALPKKYLPRGISILYEDGDLLIIDKPAGLLSVPAHYETEKNALALMTRFYRKGQAKSRKTLFPVNRLDRETSGILVFAKSLDFRERLHENWENVEKFYLAGTRKPPPLETGLIESYLVQEQNYRVHSTNDKIRGKLARTRYTVLHRQANCTILRVQLLSGRKNQIRVHFSESGFPIIGDAMYGGVPAARLALHAWQMRFSHPRAGKSLEIEAPLPDFFARYVRR